MVSASPAALAAAIEGHRSVTIEAEYGAVCVEGSVGTMAHHGPRAGQKAPCSYENGCFENVEVVGLSHVDLDSLGGCAAVLGRKTENADFWRLAEFVDLNGAHRLNQAGADAASVRALNGFWAWSQKNRGPFVKGEDVQDCTEYVSKACEVLAAILNGDEDLLVEGDKFAEAGKVLNSQSWVSTKDGVIVRVSPNFVNHLYCDPLGTVGAAVVAFNTLNGAVTISFEDTPEGVSACDIAQTLWGSLAGGHKGIAGSPRGLRMELGDLLAATAAVQAALLRR